MAIRFPPPEVESRDRFLERVFSSIKSQFSRIDVEGDRIIIEMVGDGASIRESILRLKRLQEEYAVRRVGGRTLYPSRRIHREAGLAIPLDVLAEVLKIQGRDAREHGEGLETTASWSEVAEAASAVAEAFRRMEHLPAARTTKKALAVLQVVTGAPLEELVALGLEEGVLREEGDGRLLLAGPWRDAVKRLIRAFNARKGAEGFGSEDSEAGPRQVPGGGEGGGPYPWEPDSEEADGSGPG